MNLRIFFTADLHGSELAMNKLVNAAKFYNVKDIVIGGDLTGKVLVPIVRNGDRYELELFGEHKRVKEKDLPDIEHEIRLSGEYYRVMDKREYEEAEASEKAIKRVFVEEMTSALKAFMDKAEERLKPLGAHIYLMAGNDDYEEVADYLAGMSSGAYSTITDIDGRITEIGGYSFLGYGYSNKTPWDSPRERSEEALFKDLDRLAKGADPKRSVFVIHSPPYGTKIDRAPELTSDKRQKISAGYMATKAVGSTATREIIEKYAPIAGLHGHIHEAMGMDYVKAKNGSMVPVFNPGSEYSSGVLSGIIIDFEGGKVSRYNFTKG